MLSDKPKGYKVYTQMEAHAMLEKSFNMHFRSGGRPARCYLAEVNMDKGLTCKLMEDFGDWQVGETMICLHSDRPIQLEIMHKMLANISLGDYYQGTLPRTGVDGSSMQACAFGN